MSTPIIQIAPAITPLPSMVNRPVPNIPKLNSLTPWDTFNFNYDYNSTRYKTVSLQSGWNGGKYHFDDKLIAFCDYFNQLSILTEIPHLSILVYNPPATSWDLHQRKLVTVAPYITISLSNISTANIIKAHIEAYGFNQTEKELDEYTKNAYNLFLSGVENIIGKSIESFTDNTFFYV